MISLGLRACSLPEAPGWFQPNAFEVVIRGEADIEICYATPLYIHIDTNGFAERVE